MRSSNTSRPRRETARRPLQALVTNLDASDYLGRLAIGRVVEGTLKAGVQVALCHADPDEPPLRRKLTQLMGFEGLAPGRRRGAHRR